MSLRVPFLQGTHLPSLRMAVLTRMRTPQVEHATLFTDPPHPATQLMILGLGAILSLSSLKESYARSGALAGAVEVA